MISPNFIYLIVIMVFIYIVAKFKIIPYLAARKILKEDRKNSANTAAPVGAPAPATAFTPSQFPALSPQLQAILAGAYAPPMSAPAPSVPDRRELRFDYRTIDDMADVNKFLLDLRADGIYPDRLDFIRLDDDLLVAYVTYHVTAANIHGYQP